MKGTTVEIKNLILQVLKHWRLILISMLIFAVCLDGLGYVKKSRDARKEFEKTQEVNDEMEAESVDLAVVEHAANAYKIYSGNYQVVKKYLNNSIRMQIDPNATPMATLQYMVDTHYEVRYPVISKRDNTLDILNSMALLVKGDDNCKKIATAIFSGIDSSYIMELVDIKVVEPGILNISILGRNQAECMSMVNVVKESMDNSVEELKAQYGEFDLKLVKQQYSEKVFMDLLTERQSRMSTLDSINKSMNTLVSNLSSSQLDKFYEILANGSEEKEEEEPKPEPVMKKVPLINKKFILVGLVFGAAFACFILGCLYIISGKIHCQSDIEERYDIPVLGTITVAVKKKSLFAFVDNYLSGLSDRERNLFSDEERIRMAAAGIRIAAKKAGYEKLYITGSTCDEESLRVQSMFADCVKEGFESVSCGKSILYDPESMEAMAACDGVVLVEYLEKTVVADMDKETTACARCQVPVIGCVVIR